MEHEEIGWRARRSEAFRQARSRAAEYARDPQRLNDLIGQASRKAAGRSGPLGRVRDHLLAAFRLLRAWGSGRYREVPWSALLSIIGALLYFVMPLDLLPDFMAGIGLLDDAAILSWVLGTVSEEIDQFVAWEQEQETCSDIENRD